MKRNRLAILALVLGITSFINLLGLEKGIMAIIAGWMAITGIKEEPESGGKGLAWAGLILGALSIVTIIAVLALKGPQVLDYLKNLPQPK